MDIFNLLILSVIGHSLIMMVIIAIRIFLSWQFLMIEPRNEIIRMMKNDEIDLETAKQLGAALGDHFVAEWRAAHKRHFMQGIFSFEGPVKYLGMTRKPTPDEVLERAQRLHGDT